MTNAEIYDQARDELDKLELAYHRGEIGMGTFTARVFMLGAKTQAQIVERPFNPGSAGMWIPFTLEEIRAIRRIAADLAKFPESESPEWHSILKKLSGHEPAEKEGNENDGNA